MDCMTGYLRKTRIKNLSFKLRWMGADIFCI